MNDPSSGKHYSLPFLPATPSSPSRALEGLFELTQRPLRAFNWPCALLLELENRLVCGARRKGPRKPYNVFIVPEATQEASRGLMKSVVSAQKALQGSKTETRELLGGMEENSVSPTRGH